jgi:hypothetical protein
MREKAVPMPTEADALQMIAEAHSMENVAFRMRIAKLEEALAALIDAIDEKDAAAIEKALFVGRGLTF